jgi:SAM-dependent methyltransferase
MAYARQWGRYRIIRSEEDRATFWSRTGLSAPELMGKCVLDAGCGMGRYLRIAAESEARLIVGLDLSQAVLAARDVTSGLARVVLVRADLLKPPFAAGSFDVIYSLGVLDHTPDPRGAFLGLAKLLKPGGRLVVWVYPRERAAIEWILDAHRFLSKHLPVGVLEVLSRAFAPMGGLKRRLLSSRFWLIQRFGVVLHLATIGVSMHPDPEVRVCDTLDWYAPKYLSRHAFQEVAGWFSEAGLIDVRDLSPGQALFHEGQGRGINVTGVKPPVSSS